jgi:hypothetical protein
MTLDHDHDRDTVVVEDRGSGMGAILGVIGILVLLAAVWYFALGPGAAPTTTNDGGDTVNPPAATIAPGGSAAP